jgi:ferritin
MNNLDKRREKSIGSKVSGLLIEQVANELYYHALYRTFANYFAVKGLDNLEKYYIKRAEEEINHHRWIVDRLNYVDVEFSYPAIKEVNVNIDNEITPFIKTLDVEIGTTKEIYDIANAAKEENDWETLKWLQETLINEQTEEEHISRRYLKIAQKNDADWITKADEILADYESSKNQ